MRKTLEEVLKKRDLQPVAKADLTDKVVIVIGANTGLGFEATKHLATMNPGRLILGCRSPSRGEQALKDLKATTRFEAELWIIDLSSFASVREFADKAIRELDRLDILVENAGMYVNSHEVTNDGWQSMIQVNNLGPELLALLLLPKMIQTKERFYSVGSPRLVVTSSDVHYFTELDDALINSSENIYRAMSTEKFWNESGVNNAGNYGIGMHHYNEVKLLTLFFVRALQAHLSRSSQTPITVNAVNPGFCQSELRRPLSGESEEAIATMHGLEDQFAYTAEEGSRSIVYGAVGGSEIEDSLQGAFLSLSEIAEPSDFVLSEVGRKAEEKLWNDMVAVLSTIDARVKNTIEVHLSAN